MNGCREGGNLVARLLGSLESDRCAFCRLLTTRHSGAIDRRILVDLLAEAGLQLGCRALDTAAGVLDAVCAAPKQLLAAADPENQEADDDDECDMPRGKTAHARILAVTVAEQKPGPVVDP